VGAVNTRVGENLQFLTKISIYNGTSYWMTSRKL